MTTEWDKQAAKQALQSKLHEAQIAKLQIMEQRTVCDDRIAGINGYITALQEQLNADWLKDDTTTEGTDT